MGNASVPDGWVRLSIPDRFRLGPAGFAEICGWQLKRDGDAYLIRTKESFEHAPTRLVSARLVADSATRGTQPFEAAARAVAQHGLGGLPPDVALPDEFLRPVSREDSWAAFRFHTTTAPDDELGGFLAHAFERFRQELPDVQLWLVEADPRISWRAAAARAFFAAEEQPELLDRPEEAFEGLPPSYQLMQSLAIGLAAYVNPMIMTMTPWLLGMTAARRGGSFVVLFGRAEPGFVGSQAPELLNLLRAQWATQPARRTTRPEVTAAQAAAVVRYWTQRLNAVLGLALDPLTYRTPAGEYSARRHLAALLSLERLFSSVQSILAHADRDPYVRQLFFFSVIDQLVGLGFGSWSSLLSPRKVRQQLDELELGLPPDVREILLWRCKEAADALETLRTGLGPVERVEGRAIRVRNDAGQFDSISLDEAVARYLKVIRNSSHSFREMAGEARHFSLLAAEREVPENALADIALLHLLRFLERPRIRV